jgi:hypothetical protein
MRGGLLKHERALLVTASAALVGAERGVVVMTGEQRLGALHREP